MTSQNSFLSGWHYCGFTRRVLIDDVRGKKMEHYKCLTGLGTDTQNSGRTPGLFAFEGSLFRLFKQGDAQ